MIEPWAVYAGAAISVALFIALIVAGLELLMQDRISIAIWPWIVASLVAIVASVAWDKVTPPADHLPLGGTVAGLGIFFIIGFGTVITWSFVGDLLGRNPRNYKHR